MRKRTSFTIGTSALAAAALAMSTAGAAPRFASLRRADPSSSLRTVGEAPEALPGYDAERLGWEAFRARYGEWRIRVDRRSGTPLLAEGAGIPWLDADAAFDLAGLGERARSFVGEHAALLHVDPSQLVLDRDGSGEMSPGHDVVVFRREVGGIPVEGQRFVLYVVRGRLVAFGAGRWGALTAAPVRRLDESGARAALEAMLGVADASVVDLEPAADVLVAGPPPQATAGRWTGAVGRGVAYHRAWRFRFRIDGEPEIWVAKLDAATGELLALYDDRVSQRTRVRGGVYPRSNDGLLPEGTERPDAPLPRVEVLVDGTPVTTEEFGQFRCPPGSTIETRLQGAWASIEDTCGPVSETGVCGTPLDLGDGAGTDCATPPGSQSAGDTHAARTTYWTIDASKEHARGWLPDNAWLRSPLLAHVNVVKTDQCNAFWDGTSLTFYDSNAGCSNAGELAGVVAHEFGHGLDANDGGGLETTSEAYADVVAMLQERVSCVGRGWWTGATCSGYGDTCLSCSGIRDMDWNARTARTPATPAGFIQNNCSPPDTSQGETAGPCGRESHCESYPPSEAIYDLATRDLVADGMDVDSAWQLTDRLFYQSRVGSGGNVFSCSLPDSDGCSVDNWFVKLRVADDDDGTLANGTPHAAAIFAAFDRHGVACGAATDLSNADSSSCPEMPAPVLTTSTGCENVVLSWAEVTGARRYRVLRSTTDCYSGFAVLDQTGPFMRGWTDHNVPSGTQVFYRLQAVGANPACESPVSACSWQYACACFGFDSDGDGWGEESGTAQVCDVDPEPPVGTGPAADCDDTAPDVNPAAPEVCNHRDDDCNGRSDEGFPSVVSTARWTDAPDGRPGDDAGRSMAVVGDVDGDGAADVAMGAPSDVYGNGSNYGSVVLLSGRTGTVIRKLRDPGGANGDYTYRLGYSVAAVGDLDGDGVPDLAAGAPYSSNGAKTGDGRVVLFSGATGAILRRLVDPDAASAAYLGWSVAGVGDVDGDGVPDVAAGAYDDTFGPGVSPGSVSVFSGATGARLYKVWYPNAEHAAQFGYSVARLGDLNLDGVDEIVVGMPGANTFQGVDAGRVVVLSGADGTIFWSLEDPHGHTADYLGQAVDGIPDVTGDEVPDILAGAYGRDEYDDLGNVVQANIGAVALFSGSDGVLVQWVTAIDAGAFDGLGAAVSAIRDVTGDGVPDFAAGAAGDDTAWGTDAGSVYLFDGLSGATLGKYVDGAGRGGEMLGTAVAATDVTGDGNLDVLGGAPGLVTVDGNVGGVVVFAEESDCDGDGVSPFGGDCDDTDPNRSSVSPEVCNGIDDDCDGSVDEDEDGDGYGACDGDCAPTDPTRHPGAAEICNGIDDDCDGVADDGPDADGDGFAAPCDCRDDLSSVHPGAADTCNHLDDDCNGIVDDGAAKPVASRAFTDPEGADNDHLGQAIAVLGDLDGDGVAEIAVGAPDDALPPGSNTGSVSVFSGATGGLLRKLSDPGGASGNYTRKLGRSVAALGDVDGDGVGDVAAGAPYSDSAAGKFQDGRVVVFSGASGAILYRAADPDGVNSGSLGWSLAALGDVDGDGVPDFAAGAYLDHDANGVAVGTVSIFSGATGALLRKLRDPEGMQNDYLGISVAGIGDVTADGVPDVAAGASQDQTSVGLYAGSVVVFSGADGTLVRKIIDPQGAAFDYLGTAVAGIGDVDGDGVPDLVAGADSVDLSGAPNAGRVVIFSGATAAVLRRLEDPDAATYDLLGSSVAGIGDVDGDGVPDVVAGARGDDTPLGTDAGSLIVFSGADGSRIAKLTDDSTGRADDRLGVAVAAVDLNGDGDPEFLGGATQESAALPAHGRLVVFSRESDCDGDGASAWGGDCDDGDPGVLTAPSEVAALTESRVSGAVVRLQWTSQDGTAGPGTVYDVASGALSDLRGSGGFAAAACSVDDAADSPWDDPGDVPPAGDGIWYLVRAENGCGIASYGDGAATPDPRDALDASGPCP